MTFAGLFLTGLLCSIRFEAFRIQNNEQRLHTIAKETWRNLLIVYITVRGEVERVGLPQTNEDGGPRRI